MNEAIEIIEIDRDQAKEEAEIESKQADLKQHADKLVRGFENIDDTSANRAIWELVQNACDLSPKCNITIDYSKEGFLFTHNGKPFTTATLISLIKQVSNKIDDVDVGKFGTGFITTHAFGRKFKVNSLLNIKGKFIKVKDFEIDRSPKEWKGMVANLIDQEKQVYELIKNGEMVDGEEPLTTFAYLPDTPTEMEYIKESFINLHDYIPLVLTINEKLFSVKVIDKNGDTNFYNKLEKTPINGTYVTTIRVNDEVKEIYSLKDEANEIEVILPLVKDNLSISFPSRIAKLFLYFPLIGTEQWGCNYVIHSAKFAPTEPRDGIHLKSKTEQVQENEEANRLLIERASEMIFDFVTANALQINNPINLASINFVVDSDKPLLDEYFKGLKALWISNFRDYPLVETEEGNIKPSESFFLHSELLVDDNYFDSIFNLASRYWKNIPKKHLIKKWTKIVFEWNVDSISHITIKDLILKIEEDGSLLKLEDTGDLHTFYKFLFTYEHDSFFNQHRLLPNLKGDFRKLSELNESVNLPDILLNIADLLMPDVPKRHIHPDYKYDLTLTPYSRKNFTTEINEHISKVFSENENFRHFIKIKRATEETIGANTEPEELLEESEEEKKRKEILFKFIDYCKIATSKDSTSIPSRMVKQICNYINYNEELIELASIKDDELDTRTAQKRLVRLFLNDIFLNEAKWVEKNIEILKIILSMSTYDDYKDLFLTLPAFPNQLYELCVKSTLKVDDSIPDPIKDLYDKIAKPDKPIRSTLVLKEFSEYIPKENIQTIIGLTTKIEATFSSDGQYNNISSHPLKKEILDIIKTITEVPEWGQHFPLLNGKRANIMLETVSDEKTKNDVFSIITLDTDKINKLGNLARNPYLESIIKLGEQALEDEKRTKTDFQFKHEIGKRIELLINKTLGKELEGFAVDVLDVQNGQDIVIRRGGEDVYYIEIKSRWNSDSSVMMSKNQFTNAAVNKDKYSLCCVEMSDYKKGQAERYEVDDVDVIFERINIVNTIGIEIEPLIKGILEKTDIENEITLSGDYKATIPQKLIRTGDNIDEFVTYLISKLNLQ